MAIFGLLIGFPSDKEEYVLAFEAGEFHNMAKMGVDHIHMGSAHRKNEEIFRDICDVYGYTMGIVPTTDTYCILNARKLNLS